MDSPVTPAPADDFAGCRFFLNEARDAEAQGDGGRYDACLRLAIEQLIQAIEVRCPRRLSGSEIAGKAFETPAGVQIVFGGQAPATFEKKP